MKPWQFTSNEELASDLLERLESALEWIDAVPSDMMLPAMPGFDRDEMDTAIAAAKKQLSAPSPKNDEPRPARLMAPTERLPTVAPPHHSIQSLRCTLCQSM